MKLDVFNRERQFKNWRNDIKEYGNPKLSDNNSKILLNYLDDMETGVNTARGSKKGKRGYAQLTKLLSHLQSLFMKIEERYNKDVIKLTDREINKLFSDMQDGTIKKENGENYGDLSTAIKCFKAFWHWWMKTNRKQNITIQDITEDLNSSSTIETKFVYITKDDLFKMIPYFDKKEQTILMFVFDSLIRSPTELKSLKVKDIYEQDGDVWVNIPNEISKIRGRNFNLLFSGKAVLEHIKENKLSSNDFLFTYSNEYMNWKMQKVAEQIWGDKISHPKAGELYKKITLYDLRHSGTIHLRLLAKENPADVSLDAVRERGGWADFKMLNYYSRFIGLDGKIDKVGIMTKQEKNQYEKQISELTDKIKDFEHLKLIVDKMQSFINNFGIEGDKKGEIIPISEHIKSKIDEKNI